MLRKWFQIILVILSLNIFSSSAHAGIQDIFNSIGGAINAAAVTLCRAGTFVIGNGVSHGLAGGIINQYVISHDEFENEDVESFEHDFFHGLLGRHFMEGVHLGLLLGGLASITLYPMAVYYYRKNSPENFPVMVFDDISSILFPGLALGKVCTGGRR